MNLICCPADRQGLLGDLYNVALEKRSVNEYGDVLAELTSQKYQCDPNKKKHTAKDIIMILNHATYYTLRFIRELEKTNPVKPYLIGSLLQRIWEMHIETLQNHKIDHSWPALMYWINYEIVDGTKPFTRAMFKPLLLLTDEPEEIEFTRNIIFIEVCEAIEDKTLYDAQEYQMALNSLTDNQFLEYYQKPINLVIGGIPHASLHELLKKNNPRFRSEALNTKFQSLLERFIYS